MNKYLGCGIALLISASFSSCSLYRSVTGKKGKNHETVQTRTDTTGITSSVPKPETIVKLPDTIRVANKLVDELRPLWKKRFVYKTFSGKAKMHFESADEKQEFTAHFRVRKDSIIWIAITALGGMVPVARIYITPDSLIFVNQRENEYSLLPLIEAAKILPTPVDFSTMQNLIVGEPLRDGDITNATNLADAWFIQAEDSNYIQQIIYNKTDSTMRSGQMNTRKPNGPEAKIEYSGYLNTPNGRLSTNRTINIRNGANEYSLDMNFQKTDFDQQLDFPVSIPKNYIKKQLQVKPDQK